MSWNAYLTDDRGHDEGRWHYTSNCNPMADAIIGESWWRALSGRTGPEGAALLNEVVRGLQADPDRFRGMNPSNGWGDYDSFLKTLIDMRDAVPEWPTTWSVNG